MLERCSKRPKVAADSNSRTEDSARDATDMDWDEALNFCADATDMDWDEALKFCVYMELDDALKDVNLSSFLSSGDAPSPE